MTAPTTPPADDKDWTFVLTEGCAECGFDPAVDQRLTASGSWQPSRSGTVLSSIAPSSTTTSPDSALSDTTSAGHTGTCSRARSSSLSQAWPVTVSCSSSVWPVVTTSNLGTVSR